MLTSPLTVLVPRVLRPDVLLRRQRQFSTSSGLLGVGGKRERRPAYTPRRALMYVPGSDERKISKIPRLGADCICLDCEDGVAVSQKEAARVGIRKVLNDRAVDFGRSECSVRVNSVSSGLFAKDLDTILGHSGRLPDAIHLPKVDDPTDLRHFRQAYNKAAASSGGDDDDDENDTVGLIMFVESSRALLKLPEICEAAMDLSKVSNLVPEALVFGSDDFVADVGAVRTEDATELVYARQKVVAVAKAFQLQAIDLVYIDYKNLEGLRKQSEEGARMGFTGKQVIHPGQVSVVQKAFSPSAEKVAWAEDLISEFNEHQKSGKGAFNFRGSMIDMPLVKQAQNIIAMKEFM